MESVSALIAAVVALVLAGIGLSREGGVLWYGDGINERLVQSIGNRELPDGYSYYGQKRLMLACMKGMTGLWATVSDPVQGKAHADSCLKYALDYAETSPADGLSWVVAARASLVLGDREGMNRYLEYSWEASRNEQWVASFRVSLAEDALADLSGSNADNHRKDLSVMVMSHTGIASIAGRYWKDEGFRERITDIVEALPEKEHRRFINSVRKAAKNLASAGPAHLNPISHA